MRTATARDGMEIAYHVFGRAQGEPLLMVQGLGADSRGWALQRVPFGRRFRCIAVDNRGVGGSAGAPRPYSLVEMAEDAVAVLDAEGIESAHLMGASMGGAIAQFLGVEHSERVRSLVLACTACKHHDWRRELLQEWADAVQERGMSALASDGLHWLVGPRLRRRFGGWLNLMARVLLQASPAAFVGQVAAILDAPDDVRFELCRVDVPALVITGSQDLLTPMGDAEELTELIPNATLFELTGAGHALMVEAPNAYNAAVLGFLKEQTAPTQLAS
ncbi:MAG: alpha/beta fold hydrolase [Actinobacteria bacterium]|nr:alpha/beta fold hydrolase [Actinomycetota bacterium]